MLRSKLGPIGQFSRWSDKKQLINSSPPGFSAWIAHVQGSNAVVKQYVGRDDQPEAERPFHRQLKSPTVSQCTVNDDSYTEVLMIFIRYAMQLGSERQLVYIAHSRGIMAHRKGRQNVIMWMR